MAARTPSWLAPRSFRNPKLGGRRYMILHTLLAASLLGSPPPPPMDPIFGEDKIKHFMASFVVSSLAATGARAAGVDRRGSLVMAVGIGAASGVLKEIHDSRRGQIFSVRDLLWDLAGVGSSAMLFDATR